MLRIVAITNFFLPPLGDLRRRLDQSLIYDWAMRCPIAAYSSFILYGDVYGFCQQVLQDPSMFERPDDGMVIAMLARISQWMFVVLLSIQPLFRLRPIAKSETISPRIAALMAVCVPLMFLQLERAPPSLGVNLLTVFISLLANIMSVVTVSFLGRSFSVMPEATQLVQSGPYGVVRHPLYLCEMLATAGVALQYRSLPAVGLLILAITLQVLRARWEEGVLTQTFPDFIVYRSQTSFLIPRDPLRFFASFVADFAARRRLTFVVASMVAVLAVVATVLPRLVA